MAWLQEWQTLWQNLNVVDLFVIAFVILGAWLGYRRGLWGMLVGWTASIAGLILAWIWRRPVADWVLEHTNMQPAVSTWIENRSGASALLSDGLAQSAIGVLAGLFSFLVLFFLGKFVLGMAARWLSKLMHALPIIGPIGRLLGALFGMAITMSISALLFGFLYTPLGSVLGTWQTEAVNSYLGPLLLTWYKILMPASVVQWSSIVET